MVGLHLLKGRPIVDAGGLDGRGIDKVDVGHDDRTTLKSGLHLLIAIYSYCKLNSSFTMFSYNFKLTSLRTSFNHTKVFEDMILPLH